MIAGGNIEIVRVVALQHDELKVLEMVELKISVLVQR